MPQFLQGWVNASSIVFPLLRIATIIVAGILALRIFDSALKRLGSIVPQGEVVRSKRMEQRTITLRHIVRSVGTVLIGVIVLITVARELGFDLTAVLASAGVVGIAIGFGAQSLVKDVIAGFFILLEDHYGVGDVVRIGELSGVVERMSMRVTVLRNLEGQVHVIPNGNIQMVTVLTKDWARAVVDVTVSHREELGRIFDILERIGNSVAEDMPEHVLEKPQILGVERLTEEGVTIRQIVKTPPLKQWEVMREWRKRIKTAFDEAGVEMPQRNLMRFRQEEEERAPREVR